jgi:DNA replication protein DnaC
MKPKARACDKCGEKINAHQWQGRWYGPTKVCDECDKKIQNDAFRKLIRDARENYRRKIFRESGLPASGLDRKIENFETGKNKSLINAKNIADKFVPGLGRQGLFFFGDPGVGKTHLMLSILNRLVEREDFLFISAPQISYEFKASFKEPSGIAIKLERIKSVEILAIDDLGVEKASEWWVENLYLILNHRNEEKLTTLFTSNLNPDQIAAKYHDRISSRLIEMAEFIRMDAEDFRVLKSRRTK